MTIQSDYEAVDSTWREQNQYHVALEPELMKLVEPYLLAQSFAAILSSETEDIGVYEEQQRILGAVWMGQREHHGGSAIRMPVAFIQEICVAEGHRKTGIGRKLMSFVEQWACDRNLNRLEFTVLQRNRDASSFYESLGFRYTRYEMSKSAMVLSP